MATKLLSDRERFERWISRRGTPLVRDGDGYVHQYAEDCWEAWQACLKDILTNYKPNVELANLAINVVENCEALAPGCADEGIGGDSPATLKERILELAKYQSILT